MHGTLNPATPNPQAQFCLRFEQHLRELSKRRYSVAVGFGPAWEKALEEVPLEDDDQPSVYWQLINWAKQAKLFTEEPNERRAA